MKKIIVAVGLLGAIAWVVRQLGFRFNRPSPPPPLPVPLQHELYVADLGSNRIYSFEITTDGTVVPTPWRIIDGFNQPTVGLNNPFDIAVTNAGEMWVANLGSQPHDLPSNPSITIYDASSSGAVAPSFTILPAHVFGPTLIQPVAVAWRNNPDNLLVLDGTSAGEFTKSQTPTGSVNELGQPAGLALTLSGTLYVSDQTPGNNAILSLNLQPHVMDQTPTSRIEGPLTGLNNPAHIAVDTNSRIYVVNRGTMQLNMQDASIAVFAAGAAGNVAPIQSIRGSLTSLVEPYGIAVDAADQIFVTTAHRVLVFAAGATGNVEPQQIISYAEFSNLIGIAAR
ncbi:MAG: hypothetical protein M3Q28_04980 [Pseudomonadota bacterium]|nr:hypothetical protein [Pseudomonadota bacterium]